MTAGLLERVAEIPRRYPLCLTQRRGLHRSKTIRRYGHRCAGFVQVDPWSTATHGTLWRHKLPAMTASLA